VLKNGKYSVWFRTPQGEGTGVVLLADGRMTGGDTMFSYTGSYDEDGSKFTARIATRRHTEGQQLSVFGVDNVDLELTGKSTATTASCSGTAEQAPGLTFQATLIRMADD
jgi:T3SS negative regulator,GrlR